MRVRLDYKIKAHSCVIISYIAFPCYCGLANKSFMQPNKRYCIARMTTLDKKTVTSKCRFKVTRVMRYDGRDANTCGNNCVLTLSMMIIHVISNGSCLVSQSFGFSLCGDRRVLFRDSVVKLIVSVLRLRHAR